MLPVHSTAALLVAAALRAAATRVVETTHGPVASHTDRAAGVDVWWAIPFAAPPVGALRFAPPAEPEPWALPRTSLLPPHWCPQMKLTLLGQTLSFGKEDCLYLNVFVPHDIADGERLPVLFWIYGGAFTLGASDEMGWYDGRKLAASQRVVVVTVNYRVGNMGFMALSGLLDEHGTTGLYGLLDQQLALKWTQQNIGRFGGDPGRVMIFGQSAGGISVNAHLAMPGSRGLFAAAVAESSIPISQIAFMPLAQAADFGERYSALLGCPAGPSQLACLRALPLKDVLAPTLGLGASAFPDAPPGTLPRFLPLAFWPVVDGTQRGMPASPLRTVEGGLPWADVPLVMGTVKDEGTLFVEATPLFCDGGASLPLNKSAFIRCSARLLPNASVVDAVLQKYARFVTLTPTYSNNVSGAEDYSSLSAHFQRDWLMACPTRRFLRAVNERRRADAAAAPPAAPAAPRSAADAEAGGACVCNNECKARCFGWKVTKNGICNDGGPGNAGPLPVMCGSICAAGTDCDDCGPSTRADGKSPGALCPAPPPAPPAPPASYMYTFNSTMDGGVMYQKLGDYHTAELSYVFGNPWFAHLFNWTAADARLSHQMGTYWAAVARGGRPAGPCPGCIEWPEYSATPSAQPRGSDRHIVFDSAQGGSAGLTVDDGLYTEFCDFWDSVGYL